MHATARQLGVGRKLTSAVACALVAGAVGCIPDLGKALAPLQADASVDAAAGLDSGLDSGPGLDSGLDATPGLDSGPDTSVEPDSGGGPLCDDSAPSEEVDRYAWGENFTFFFTPAGPDIYTLYVPANALVHFQLAGSLNEEVHIFQIRIPGCETPELGMGTEGNEVTWDWKAPREPGTYSNLGRCVNHAGMEFDIVVDP